MNGLLVHPEWWPLLLLAPAGWFLLQGLDRIRRRRLAQIVGPRLRGYAISSQPRERRRRRRALLSAGLLAAAVALLQPMWGEGTHRVEQRGVDIVVCLDVSRSMLARDLAPDRLRRARREIAVLGDRVRGDRLALVAFAGEARLVAPLTRDAASFSKLLEAVDTLSVARGGTDLAAALDVALGALDEEAGRHSVVLLITDGEDLEGRGRRAAQRCRDRGVVVHTIGFGSVQGAKIPISSGGGETFLRDAEGNDVVTVMDPASLRAIADAAGGFHVDATLEPLALVNLYEDSIVPMARRAYDEERRRSRENRFQWPLLLALVLWILDLGLGDRRRR